LKEAPIPSKIHCGSNRMFSAQESGDGRHWVQQGIYKTDIR